MFIHDSKSLHAHQKYTKSTYYLFQISRDIAIIDIVNFYMVLTSHQTRISHFNMKYVDGTDYDHRCNSSINDHELPSKYEYAILQRCSDLSFKFTNTCIITFKSY